MDKIAKLLQKIGLPERQKLLDIVEQLLTSQTDNLNIVKVKNTDFFRLKFGRFRIIFHKDGQEPVIDSIRLRNKNTYKDL